MANSAHRFETAGTSDSAKREENERTAQSLRADAQVSPAEQTTQNKPTAETSKPSSSFNLLDAAAKYKAQSAAGETVQPGAKDSASTQTAGKDPGTGGAATPKPGDAQTAAAATQNTSALADLHAKPPSYLHNGIDAVTSRFISNDQARETVNTLTAEFMKTAAMFALKKVGRGSVAAIYGLDQASPTTSLGAQVADFGLGATKGLVIRSVFEFGGPAGRFPPTKGVAMGIASRAAEDTLRRDTFTDPSAAIARLGSNTFDWRMMALDAVVWTGAEATFGAMNAYTRGALVKSPLASGVTMGTTFGVMNGSGGELIRQIKANENIDVAKIAEQGAIMGVMSAAGAATGIKGSLKYYEWRQRRATDGTTPPVERSPEPVRSRLDDVPKPAPRQFIITGGKEALESFRAKQSDSALITAREILPKYTLSQSPSAREQISGRGSTLIVTPSDLVKTSYMFGPHARLGGELTRPTPSRTGPEQSLFFQRLGANESKLLPQNQYADLLVTCYPENLPTSQRDRHAFADGYGKVWMMTDRSNRLLLTNELAPSAVRKWREGGFSEPTRLDAGQTKLDLMAPLLVGDPKDPHGEASKPAWAEFDRQLAEAKKLGEPAISTDIWWGIIEPKKGQFDFSYVDKLASHIEKAGLQWIPILSFHKAGGNIGDNVTVPLPEWVWKHVGEQLPQKSPDAAKYKSEQGNASEEYISLWADKPAVELYKSVMTAFQKQYADKKNMIAEINVSLGPAGEMRYPSYNSHDTNTGYPTRGALQAYSEPAVQAFREFALAKYGSLEGVQKAWNFENLTLEQITPPREPHGFFERNDHHNMQYGRDFFDWYNQSLVDHGSRVMTAAQEVFSQKGSAFAGVDLGAKVPGVHWRVGRWENNQIVNGDRLAELTAGLIRTSRNDWHQEDGGRGYRPILEMFKDLHKKNDSDTLICPSFTCLELADGDNGPDKMAMPFSLASWFGKEGERQGLWLRGENALSHTLADGGSWDRVRSHLFLPDKPGAYHGVTFLRMSDVVDNPVARAKAAEIIAAIRSVPPSWFDNFHRLKNPDNPKPLQSLPLLRLVPGAKPAAEAKTAG